MKASRFTEEQITGVLREQEAGVATAEVCRRHGISAATFYKWKAKYGGLEVSEARRLRTPETENAKLKKLLAEAFFLAGTSRFPPPFIEARHTPGSCPNFITVISFNDIITLGRKPCAH